MLLLVRVEDHVDPVPRVDKMHARIGISGTRNRGPELRVERHQLAAQQPARFIRRWRKLRGKLSRNACRRSWEWPVDLRPDLIEVSILEISPERVDTHARRRDLRPDSVTHVSE